jgi:hypothetical protein
MAEMAIDREGSLLSIVVVGDFNPAIFQPAWFAAEELLRSGEAETASVEIVHSDVAIFRTDWLRVQVTRDRLHVQTERESDFGALRDLVVGTLTLLRHSPTRICGINHDVTLQFRDRDQFDELGWRLVPPDNWSEVLERPGMALLQEQGMRTDGREGYIRVKVEPILDESLRAVVGVNDHVIVGATNEPRSTALIAGFLLEEWAEVTSRAARILDHVEHLAK